MRDRLIEIISDELGDINCAKLWAADIADRLLANGVIVPPVKVNQFAYVIDRADIRQPIKEKIVLEIQCGYSGNLIVLQDTPLRLRRAYHFGDFGKIIFPTKEQRKEQYDLINRLIQANLDKKGPDCTNCKYHKDVQESPYYDYTTCKFDTSVELPGGLDYRHYCDRYEFMGFLEVEDD